MTQDVTAWLEELDLNEYAALFAENKIDYEVLPELTEADFKELDVPLGHRKKLMKAIAALGGGAAVPAVSPAEPDDGPAPESFTPRHLAERILQSRAALEGERKQITVLFADIRGSLELIENTDPEEAHSIIGPAIEAMMDAVHRYEGTVNKVLGDGVMALFGAPIAHEDHAVRACYAALAMQTGITRLNEEVRRRFGVEVQLRVGLHSGEVIVRAIGNDLTVDYDAIGMTTHLAARMEQLATPGTTRITAVTLRLAEGFVRVEPLGPIPVKGMPEPVEVYELVGASEARTRLQALGKAGFTRFVGRQTEMDALERALQRAGDGQGQVVSVVGEPGVGKSRLYHEFTHGHQVRDWLVLESGSVSHGRATAYLPIIDLLKGYFGISVRDDARAIRERVTGKLLTLDESLRAIEAPLLSLFEVSVNDTEWQAMEPGQRRRRVLEACRALLLREAQVQPLVIVFEDLHWIDSETQAFLDLLVGSIPGTRTLLLMNYRPEYVDPWSTRSYYTRIRIDPLQPQGAAELLDDLLGGGAEMGPLRDLLIARTQGNPFFLEESVKALADDGTLSGARGAYGLAVPVTSISVPASVQTVLAARIDRLVPEEKQLLQTASVIGKDFSLPLLQAVVAREQADVPQRLARLQEAELVYETRIFPDPEFTFKHALTHDVAYGSLLSDRKKRLHTTILEAMEDLYAGRESEHLDRFAYHAIQGEQWEKAHRHARDAGLKASTLSANHSAVESFENAIAALGHLPETPALLSENIDLRFQVRDALFVTGNVAPIPAHLEAAERIAARLDDRARLAETLLYQSGFHWSDGEHRMAIEVAERARRLGEEMGDAEVLGLAGYRLATAYGLLGEFEDCARTAADGMAALRDVSETLFRFGGLTYTFCCSFRSMACAELGDFETAEAVGLEGYRIAKEANHGYSIAVSCFGLGHTYLLRGRYREALPVLSDGMDQTVVHGLAATVPWVASRFAHASAMAGDHEKAAEMIEIACVPDTYSMSMQHGFAFIYSGMACLAMSEYTQAVELAQRGIAKAESDDEAAVEAWAYWLLGEATLHRDEADPTAAIIAYTEAAQRAGRLKMATLQAYAHLGHGNALAARGETAAAREQHMLAGDIATRHHITPVLERATDRLTAAP